jgi:hypothetical protein
MPYSDHFFQFYDKLSENDLTLGSELTDFSWFIA